MGKIKAAKTGEYEGYPVYYCEGLESPTGVSTELGDPIILYNDDFLALPENIRKAMLQHEIGHIINNHSPKNNSIEQEFEADLYASNNTSKNDVITALNYCKTLLLFNGNILDSLNKRIFHLNRMV